MRQADARTLLMRLIDRHERARTDRTIAERPSQEFAEPGERRALTETLEAAAEAGAVSLGWDRDAPHLIAKVKLVDPPSLYAFLGRTPASQLAAAAATRISAIQAITEPARGLIQELLAAWGAGTKVAGLGFQDVGEATALVAALDAAFTELPGDVPLRTRSARLLGDSKALERALPAMISYLRHSGQIDAELSRGEAVERLGLSKYPQPVLVAGDLVVNGIDVSDWHYIGLPPELASGVVAPQDTRSVLSIENLESFNRHVRTSRQPGDVVVYTGGFPSAAVLSALRRLVADIGILHHWGDIDPGGVRIGRHLETALGVEVRTHLMEPAVAMRLGAVPRSPQPAPRMPAESAFAQLAAYLRMPDAAWLEQEIVDPSPVDAGISAANGRAADTSPAQRR